MAKSISLKSKARLGKDVVSRQIQGEEVILNLQTGTYFGLDEVGTFIWNQMKKELTLHQIAQDLLQEYQASSEEIEKDLLVLAERLHQCQLIELS